MAKNSPRPITDELRIRWALEHFGAKRTKIEVLARQEGRNPGVISRAIREAFDRGLVGIVELRKAAVETDPELEQALVDKFDDLTKASVIIQPQMAAGSQKNKVRRTGDELHEKLGRVVAEFLAQGQLIFGRSPRIGVSSGRGVYYTIDCLRQFTRRTPLRVRDARVLSLSGCLLAKAHALNPDTTMDADDNAGSLASCFAQSAVFEKITHPLGYELDELRSVRARTWLDRWNEKRPTHGLIGVGVLTEGHRFVEYLNQGAGSPEHDQMRQYIGPIYDLLKQLVARCDSIPKSRPEYCPVADIANHLFFVEPPSDVKIQETMRKDIESRIKQINERLLNVGEQQLREIGTMILVAGTRRKASAIKTLLTKYSNIQYLATDSETAKELLRA